MDQGDSFSSELRRRKVFQTGGTYVVAALALWGGVEIATQAFGWPDRVLQIVIITSVAGLPLALVASWLFDVRRDATSRSAERFRRDVTIGLLVGLVASAGLVLLLWGVFGGPRVPSVLLESRDWRQITYSGEVAGPAISPDGGSVAYVERGESGGVPFRRLMVMDLDTGDELELARYGHSLAHPVWHPGGTRIAFYSGGLIEHRHGIYTVSPLGRDPRLLFAAENDAFDWSPDGERLVVLDDGALYRLTVSDSDVRADTVELPSMSNVSDVVWSPSGRLVAVTTSDFETQRAYVHLMSLDGRVSDVLADGRAVEWTADGDWLVLERGQEYFAARVSGSGLFQDDEVPLPLPYDNVGGWTYHDRSGRLVLSWGPEVSHLQRVSLGEEDAEPVQVTRGTASHAMPSVSADGRLLAYIRWTPGGSGDLYYRPAMGGAEQRLTRTGGIGNVGPWSLDGSRLVYTAQGDSGYVVMTVGLDGAPPRAVGSLPVTGPTMSRPVELKRGGNVVVYTLPDHENLALLDLETGEERIVLPEREDPSDWRGRPTLSEDGTRLAYLSGLRVGPRRLWTLELPDGEPVRLAEGNVEPLLWLTSDTLVVAYGTHASSRVDVREVAAVSVRDGGARRLGEFPDGCEFLSVTRDASTLYCTTGESYSDLWLGVP